jgi:hypothetical protein
MGISCVLILVDLLHYSHEADFIPEILKKNEKKLVLIFNYINDVISLNNSKFDVHIQVLMQLWKVATYRWEKTVHEEKSKPSLVVMFRS